MKTLKKKGTRVATFYGVKRGIGFHREFIEFWPGEEFSILYLAQKIADFEVFFYTIPWYDLKSGRHLKRKQEMMPVKELSEILEFKEKYFNEFVEATLNIEIF